MNPTGSRRFFVSAPRIKLKLVGIAIFAWLAGIYALVIGAQVVLPTSLSKSVVGVVLVVGVLSYLAFIGYALTPKQVPIDVAPNTLTIDEGRVGTFDVGGARLGVWNVPMNHVAAGTALHLEDGPRRYCLGGRDHRPSPNMRLDAPTVETVDAYIPAGDFDALLVAMSPSWSEAAPLERVVRCTLMPNRAVGPLTQLLGQRPPALVVELDAREARVIDLATGLPVASAPIASVGAERAQHVYTGRPSFTMPVLVLHVPGAEPIRFGIPDYRFSWRAPVASSSAPPYVVGGPDWLTLVERFGAKDSLVIGSG